MQHLSINHDDWLLRRGDYVFGLAKTLTRLPKKEAQEYLDALIGNGLISKEEEWLIQYNIALAPGMAIANEVMRDMLLQRSPDGLLTKAPKRVKRDGPPRPKRPRPTLPPEEA